VSGIAATKRKTCRSTSMCNPSSERDYQHPRGRVKSGPSVCANGAVSLPLSRCDRLERFVQVTRGADAPRSPRQSKSERGASAPRAIVSHCQNTGAYALDLCISTSTYAHRSPNPSEVRSTYVLVGTQQPITADQRE